MGVYHAGIFIRWQQGYQSYPLKTQVVSSSIVMHCNLVKIILLASFSTALAQGQRHSNIPAIPPNIPPNFVQAPVRRPSQPRIVYFDNNNLPPHHTALVRTKETWMHLQPSAWNPGTHSVVPKFTNIKIVDTAPNGFPEGYTMVKTGQGLGVLDHYKPGKVPEHIVSKDTIRKASEKAEMRNRYRRRKQKESTSSS